MAGRQLKLTESSDPPPCEDLVTVKSKYSTFDPGDELGLAVSGVLARYLDFRGKRHVVTDEALFPAAEANGEGLIDAVTHTNGEPHAFAHVGGKVERSEELGVIRREGKLRLFDPTDGGGQPGAMSEADLV